MTFVVLCLPMLFKFNLYELLFDITYYLVRNFAKYSNYYHNCIKMLVPHL